MNVDAGVDYRLRTLTQAHRGFRPSTMKPGRKWINYGWRGGGETRKFTDIRNQPSAAGEMGVENQTLAVSFTTLCVDAPVSMTILRSHASFTQSCCLMTSYDAVDGERSATFYCAGGWFYERHVKLVVSAEVPLYDIFRASG